MVNNKANDQIIMGIVIRLCTGCFLTFPSRFIMLLRNIEDTLSTFATFELSKYFYEVIEKICGNPCDAAFFPGRSPLAMSHYEKKI